MSSADESSMTFAVIFALVWVGFGIAGVLILLSKGYASAAAKWGCLAWLLFGWMPLLIIPAGGPITLLVALKSRGKKRCPYCKTLIPKDAIRCPQCAADLTDQSYSVKVSAPAAPPARAGKSAFCTHCGQPVPIGSKFCTSCGEALA